MIRYEPSADIGNAECLALYCTMSYVLVACSGLTMRPTDGDAVATATTEDADVYENNEVTYRWSLTSSSAAESPGPPLESI